MVLFNVKRKLNELLEEQVLVRRIVHTYDGEEECVCALETCESLYIECLMAVYVHGLEDANFESP